MFDIYIKNFSSESSYITNEFLLYSIPADSDINLLVNPKVNVEMGKAGSFEFSMNPDHPYYNSLHQMKTIFRIVYDGDTIFRGRVLTIDANHFTGVKRVHCEGDLAFLLDSQMEGVADDQRPKTDAFTYFQSVVNSHNSQMSESGNTDKQFSIGEVPGHYSSSVQSAQKISPDSNYRYGSGSWRDSQSALSDLTNGFGGFIQTRYQNGSVFLDWLDAYYRTDVNPQTIEIGENLIDITSNSEVNNIFTAVIPVGSKDGKNLYIDEYKTNIHGNNKRILVPQIIHVFTDAQLNSGFHSKQDYLNAIDDYGIVYHTETFSNADTKEKLWNYAVDWIKNNYCGGIDSFTISALDMHVIGESNGKFLIGDRVHVIYPDVNGRKVDPEAVINKMMTVMSATYVLHNPEKNQYKIGIPNAILKKNYGEKKSSKKGSGALGNKTRNDKEKEEFDDSWKTYEKSLIQSFVIDAVNHSEAYSDYRKEYGDEQAAAVARAAYIAVGSEINQTPGFRHRSATVSINTDGIQLAGPINPAAAKIAEETGKVHNDLVIKARSNAAAAGIEILPNVPGIAVDWNTQQLNKFNNFVLGQFGVDPSTGGVKLTTSTVTGTTASSAGDNKTSSALDGIKGAFTGLKAQLADNLDDVTNVIDESSIPNVDLSGPLSKVGVGNSGFTFASLLGKEGDNGTSGSVRAGNMIIDPVTGELTSVATTVMDGFSGKSAALGAVFGKNPLDDVTKLLTGEEEPTVNVDGKTGTQQVGKDSQGNWYVKLNDSITYQDKDGHTHVLEPGFVTAKDFHLEDIPSFKTKLAVIDTLVAGIANIGELYAAKAKIDNLTGSTIVANTIVRASNFYGGQASVSQLVSTGTIAGRTVVGQNIGWVDSESGSYTYLDLKNVKIGNSFVDGLYLTGTGRESTLTIPNGVASIEVDDNPPSGKIGFKYTTFDNSTPVAVNFNIAATQTYIDGVAAARDTVNVAKGDWNGGVIDFSPTYNGETTSGTSSILTLQMELSQNALHPEVGVVSVKDFNGGNPIATGASHNVYLKADDDYCYITSTSASPSSSNIIAKITNPKQGGGENVTITSATRTAEGDDASTIADADSPTLGSAGYKYFMITATASNSATRKIGVNATPTYENGYNKGLTDAPVGFVTPVTDAIVHTNYSDSTSDPGWGANRNLTMEGHMQKLITITAKNGDTRTLRINATSTYNAVTISSTSYNESSDDKKIADAWSYDKGLSMDGKKYRTFTVTASNSATYKIRMNAAATYNNGWNNLVAKVSSSSGSDYAQFSGSSSATSALSKSNGTVSGYIWLKNASDTWVKGRSVSISTADCYNRSVTLTYKGSVDGVYTWTTSTYVSGLTTGNRYTVRFNV